MIYVFDQHSTIATDSMTAKGTYAYVQKLTTGMYFMVFNTEMSNKKLKVVIAHELIHVWQHETGKLKTINNHKSIYDGKIYDRQLIPYSMYPWEREAFNKQKQLSLQL
ncbi:MAG TPA: hypothetical protein VK982_12145 [Bacteroidales bacterium]|nr:hypothetical protein [Bacteroidales bacterium]